MKNKFNWMPVLRTGTFTDKNNQSVKIDEAALDKIIANTDLTKEPQLVVEHPKFDEIGFGTIERLKRVGNYLFALPKTVEEKFKKAVNSGKLPGRSVTLDKNNFSLRNISFLPPEIPPAVSGLGEYSFRAPSNSPEGGELELQLSIPGVESHFADIETSDFEFARYEVSKYPFKTIQDIFRNIKNFFIEDKSLEDADKIIPEWLLNEVGTAPAIWEKIDEENKMIANSFSQQNNEDNKMPGKTFDLSKFDLSKIDANLRALIEGMNTKLNSLQTELTNKTTELQSATSKLTEAETAQLKNEVLQFCAGDDIKLKVKPAIKDKLVNFLMAQKGKDVIEFSTADNTKVQLNAFEFAKELVKMLPDVIDPVELATGDKGKSINQEEDEYKAGADAAERLNKVF